MRASLDLTVVVPTWYAISGDEQRKEWCKPESREDSNECSDRGQVEDQVIRRSPQLLMVVYEVRCKLNGDTVRST